MASQKQREGSKRKGQVTMVTAVREWGDVHCIDNMEAMGAGLREIVVKGFTESSLKWAEEKKERKGVIDSP